MPEGGEAEKMKEALHKFARVNGRSLSNQMMVILREKLKQENLL